jgi:hypothetical protein
MFLRVLKTLLILLAFPLQHVFAQASPTSTKNSRVLTKEFYASGKIKSITITKIRYPRNIDLFNFYKKTITIRTEYDSISSNKINHSKRITKVGIGGKHCYEYYYRRIDYNQEGKRLRFEKSHCDKNRNKYIIYVNGKKDFIHIERPRKRKR